MRILSFLLLLFVFSTAPAQDINTRFYGETAGADLLAKHTIALPDGGLLMAGTTNTTDTGGYRVLLLRCDGAGKAVWQRTYMRGTAFWVDAAPGGGFIVGGRSERGAFEDIDGFVLRVDENGEEIWNKRILTGIRSSVTCVRAMPDGRFAACGNVLNDTDEESKMVAFLTVLDDLGATSIYKEHADLLFLDNIAYRLEVDKSNEITLLWGAMQENMITRYTAEGQLKWEQNLHDFSLYLYDTHSAASMSVNDQGDVIIAGSVISEEVLFVLSAATGALIQKHAFDGNLMVAFNIVPVPDGVHFYYITSIFDYNTNSGYYAFISSDIKWSDNILTSDTLKLSKIYYSETVVQNDSTIYLIQEHFYAEDDINVGVIRKKMEKLTIEAEWKFSAGQPASNDYFETSCSSSDAGYFLVGRKRDYDTRQIYYNVIKTNADGDVKSSATLGIASSVIGVKVHPLTDGGAIVISPNNMIWRLGQSSEIVWTKSVPFGHLFVDSQNRFSIVSELTVSMTEKNTMIRRYDDAGELLDEHKVFENGGYNWSILGGVTGFNDRIILFGSGSSDNTPDSYFNNKVYGLDKDGNLEKEFTLPAQYNRITKPVFFRSKTGDIIVAEKHAFRGQHSIYLICLRNGVPAWDYLFFIKGGRSLGDFQIDDAPCGGYVLATKTLANYRNNLDLPSPAIHDLTVLQHIGDDGTGGVFFTFRPYPEPFTVDTAFIPGYTYKEWGSQLNGQTSDWFFRTISFPSGKTVHTENNHLGIMPNPSAGHTCLEFVSEKSGPLEVTVADASGRVVDRFDNFKTDAVWMMPYRANLPAGVYVISIRFPGEKPVTEQWVKVR